MELSKKPENPYGKTVSEILAMMASGVLKNPPQVSNALHDAWVLVLVMRKVKPELLIPTCAEMCNRGGWFPTPADFATLAFEVEERAGREKDLAATNALVKAEAEAERKALLEQLIAEGVDITKPVPREKVVALISGLGERLGPKSLEVVTSKEAI